MAIFRYLVVFPNWDHARTGMAILNEWARIQPDDWHIQRFLSQVAVNVIAIELEKNNSIDRDNHAHYVALFETAHDAA